MEIKSQYQSVKMNEFINQLPNLTTKKVKKGTILVHQGEQCRYAYHVVKGCLKSYVIGKDDKEHIVQFAPENWLITDMDSFINNSKSIVYINAIEDSEVQLLTQPSAKDIEALSKTALVEQMRRMQNNIIANNKRLIHLLSSTAEERYLEFIETYPSLMQRLPLKLIASYLGITPEFLSRIRKHLAEKK